MWPGPEAAVSGRARSLPHFAEAVAPAVAGAHREPLQTRIHLHPARAVTELGITDENGLEGVWLFKALSLAGRGNPGLCHFRHIDGDHLSRCHQTNHRRRRAPESSGATDPLDSDGRGRFSDPARFRFVANLVEQHFRTESDFRSSERSLFPHSTAAASLVRQSGHRRFDDADPGRREFGRARFDRRSGAGSGGDSPGHHRYRGDVLHQCKAGAAGFGAVSFADSGAHWLTP